MGKIYKRKRRSCPMCKPHKVGWAKKNTDKTINLIKETDKEIEEENTEFKKLKKQND